MLKLSDINTNVIKRTGGIECIAIINGYMESRVYYGYSISCAKRMFRSFVNDKAKNIYEYAS